MNILVCPNTSIVSGASLVALDLAAAMHERGHRVIVLGPPGALVDQLGSIGIEWIEMPAGDDGSDPEVGERRTLWPSPASIRRIRRVAAAEQVDVVHTYEWPRCLEAGYGAHLVGAVPLVSSILAVRAPKFLPKTAHIIVGTKELADLMSRRGFPAVTLVEPRLDRLPPPSATDTAAFAARHDLDSDLARVVVASRLASFKMDGLRLAIDAVEMVEATLPVQLVIVGEGSGEGELRARAERVNARLDRRAVVFTGVVRNVAAAYAAADLVLGMGTAVLGGMAQGKPAVVIGEKGFSALLTDETATALSEVGFFGEGSPDDPATRLAGHIAEALHDPRRTAELAACSLDVVRRRPTKDQTEAKVELVYREAIGATHGPAERGLHAGRSLGRFVAMRARGRLTRRVTRARGPHGQGDVA